MRVVHLNSSDAGGGAARTALRLHLALREAGADSLLLVRERTLDAAAVLRHDGRVDRLFPRLRARLDSIPTRLHGRRAGAFSTAFVPDRVSAAVEALRPSLVNLHWIGHGFMRIEALRSLAVPVVWTLHDAWPFTGGCHVPQGCERFVARCGACPVLGSRRERDLSRLVWARKERRWRDLPVVLVAPSRWMAGRAGRSSLFRRARIEVIPNGVDTSVYRPLDRREARARLGVPVDAPTVLFAAMWADHDPNKGFHLLAPALAAVRLSGGRRPHLLVAGSDSLHLHPGLGGVRATPLGVLRDEARMVQALAAADVVAVPSLQENFPNAALEALACARPVVAFRQGGMPEIVDDEVTGLLAAPFEVRGLAEALRAVLDAPGRAEEMGRTGRARVEARLGLGAQARAYLALYEGVLRAAPRAPFAA